jgi:glucose-1-phosphate adenylyltransferase
MNAFCLLFTDITNSENIGTISEHRSVASLPFGARYRLIDFILSSLVYASVPNVGVIARNNYNSLVDHLGWGKDWDLNRKNGGLKILTPYANASKGKENRFEALNSVKPYIISMLPEYCIIADSNIVCNIDFNEVFKKHLEMDADITVVCHKGTPAVGETEAFFDENGRINDVLYTSEDKDYESEIITQIYLLKKELLLKLIDKATTFDWTDFNRDVIAKGVGTYKIFAYSHKEYCTVVNNLSVYYRANMDLLKDEIRYELFKSSKRVLTKVKDSVPILFGDTCSVHNSLIADGCQIEGTIENSIIFRDVHVKSGAFIKNSIIMQGTAIDHDVSLSYVILDKNIIITEGKVLNGSDNYPFVISKGITV